MWRRVSVTVGFMTERKSSARKDLDRAQKKQHAVRLLRFTRFGGDLVGFVVAVGSQRVLVARTEDGGYPGGWIASRVEHVDQIERVKSFEETFARSLPSWPPTAPEGVELGTTAALLKTLAQHGPLVAIEQEDRLADCEWVGRFVEVADQRPWLHEVDQLAQWHDSPSGYRLRNITTASIGTPYLQALQAVLEQQGNSNPPEED